ncbi:MAG: YgiT-type zinc finger protein [Kosmotoga sp.]|nr:MAG: YgiT-type zinc finger protein [Kosmotoga sp.]
MSARSQLLYIGCFSQSRNTAFGKIKIQHFIGMVCMKCPLCESDLVEKIEKKDKALFKGKEVEISYYIYHCEKCDEDILDSESLEQSWRKIWNDYEKENNYSLPKELKEAREN